MKRLLSMLLFAALAVIQLHAQESVLLAEKGRSNCCIVLPANASAAHRRAGEELSRYIALAASCPAPAIAQKAEEALVPVHLELMQEDLPDRDSFRLLCNKGGVWIQAANEQALYHGVYRFLKKYAKMRWLVPGVDGEYYSPGTRIAVPFQETTESPAFPFRYLEFIYANVNSMMPDTWDWILRNNFVLASAHGHVDTTKAWKPEKPELGEALRIRGCRCKDWKIFGGLITGARIRPDAKTEAEEMKALFATHPEYFPLVNGKRVLMRGYEQPCTSNPEVGRIMAEHAVMFSSRLAESNEFLIMNDDGTTWCECEACQALDPPDEKSKNYRSTRYWTLLNRIFKDVLDEYPSIQAFGLAYQNFQTVPSGVKIDERINVGLSFNRRCFRHNLDDPKCLANRQFLEYYRDWGKLPNRTYSREEFHAGVGGNYMPSERALISGFKLYRQLGIDGTSICVGPPDGTYRAIYGDKVKLGWFCMWQALYLAGEFLWNPEADYEGLLEEANRLYYGPAWDGGMREFRSLLIKACDETPGCFGWGHGSHPGRVLAKVGLPEKLLALLDDAEKAANGDPRALAHVKRDRHLFQITLLKSTKEFFRSYKELTAFENSSPVILDGKPNEAAWKQAEVYSSFVKHKKKSDAPDEMAALQTFVRVMYDQGNLWVFIEALENNPAGVINERKPGEAPWGDDSLELFLTHPNFNGKYYHFAWTRNGTFYQAQTIPGSLDADTTIETDVEIKTQVLADRWTAEMKIPVARLGQDCIVGHTWEINVARNRINQDGKNELISLAWGGFHGAFFPLSLAGKKTADVSGLKDTRLWKNGNFNDVFKRPNDKWAKGWDLGKEELLARGWNLNTAQPGASFELLKHPGSNDDFFVLLKKGNFFQRHLGKDEAIRCSFRLKGHGKFKIMIFRFDRGEHHYKHLGTDLLRVLTLNSDEWVTYQMDYLKKAADETVGLVFWNDGNGDLYIDDAYVFGIPAADVKVEKK